MKNKDDLVIFMMYYYRKYFTLLNKKISQR